MWPLIVLAVATPPDLTPIAGGFDIWNLVQFGFVGVVLACILTQKLIVPEWTLRQERERNVKAEGELRAENERLRGQVDRLQVMVETRMIPALTLTTEVVARYTEEQTKSRLEADLRDGRR